MLWEVGRREVVVVKGDGRARGLSVGDWRCGLDGMRRARVCVMHRFGSGGIAGF